MSTSSSAAVVCVALIFGCGGVHPGMGRQLEANDAAPEWARVQPECPPTQRCVIGQASGESTRSKAIAAAMLDGRRQLAEQALPVELQSQYSARRDGDERRFVSATHAQLAGRLPGVKRLAEASRRQVVARLRSAEVLHDAWVLLSADAARIEALAQEERSRTDLEARALRKALATLTAQTEWRSATTRLGQARARIESMTFGPARADLTTAWSAAVHQQMDRLAIEQVAATSSRAGRQLHLRVRADQRPVAGVVVEASGACGVARAKTDHDGRVQLVLPRPLGTCAVGLHVNGMEAPALTSRACLTIAWRTNLGGAAMREALARQSRSLLASQTCAGGPGEAPLALQADLRANLGALQQLRRGLFQQGMSARVAVHDTQGAVLRRPTHETLLGRSRSAVRAQLADRLASVGLNTLRECIAHLEKKGFTQ